MKRVIILTISSIYWVLWTLAFPWFLMALNRRVTRVPAVRKLMIPQPSRLFLKSQIKRSSPDFEFGEPLPEFDVAAYRSKQS